METFYHHEFYTAIMNEDLGRIKDLTNKHGSNFLISEQDTAPGDLWKGLAAIPLHLAVSKTRLKSIQTLLSAGADPEIRDRLGRTSLHLVIDSLPQILTSEHTSGSKLRTVGVPKCSQAEACLQVLCVHGNINAEVEGGSGHTALHLSVHRRAVSAVHILARHGANVNAVNSSGMTPLHMAAGLLHKELVAGLIKVGADVNMVIRHSGSTSLHMAVVALAMKPAKNRTEGNGCIRELLGHGAAIDAVNKAGITPLHEVCKMASEQLVDLLVGYGADVNKPTAAGENCLFLFLDHPPNAKRHSLLAKLLHLTSPLTLHNHKGQLPSTLMLPCFIKQRQQLLELLQQPQKLQHICKRFIYVSHVHTQEGIRSVLPQRVYDYVFHHWDDFFVEDFEDELLHDTLHNISI